MKKINKLLILVPAICLTGCNITKSDIEDIIDDFDSFDINNYDPNSSFDSLLNYGQEIGVELSFKYRETSDYFELVDDGGIVERHELFENEYSLGKYQDIFWCYRQNLEGEEDHTKYGIGTDTYNVFAYRNEAWHLFDEEDDQYLLGFEEEIRTHLALDYTLYSTFQAHGEGPTNVTVAGRKCAKYTVNFTFSNDHVLSASCSFDVDLGLLLSLSYSETYVTDTSSLTTGKSIEVSSFAIAPKYPVFPEVK